MKVSYLKKPGNRKERINFIIKKLGLESANLLMSFTDRLHHTECGCGYDRSVFDERDWKEDIESFTEEIDRCPEDEEFIRNGYKIKEG